MKKTVSIIIPIYNGEKYIEKCMNSIFKQTYQNIEIICMNDESKDNSLKILKKIQKEHNNLKIINQKNQGQAIARNNGIKKATGEYLTCIDQDDYIEPDYIQTLIQHIGTNDILITGYNRVDEKGQVLYSKIPNECEYDRYKYCASWGKLYKTKFIKENQIEFGKYKIGEDIYFLLCACSFTKKVKSYAYAGYNNLRNFSSVSNNINLVKNNNNMMPMLEDMKNKIDFSNFNKDKLLYFFQKTVTHYVYNQRKNCTLKEYNQIYKEYFHWLEELFKEYNSKIKFVNEKEEEFRINLIMNLFTLFKKLHIIPCLLFLIKILTPKTNK